MVDSRTPLATVYLKGTTVNIIGIPAFYGYQRAIVHVSNYGSATLGTKDTLCDGNVCTYNTLQQLCQELSWKCQ